MQVKTKPTTFFRRAPKDSFELVCDIAFANDCIVTKTEQLTYFIVLFLSHVCTHLYDLSVLVSLLLNWCEESMMEIPLGVHVKDLIRHLATSAVNEWILAPHPTLLRGEWPRPQVPCDSYLDIQVLQKFMFRCNFVGWSSRTQFEESYVTLLGVVNHITEDRCNDAEVRLFLVALISR